jgi:uncharacterized protein (DUF488 family)
MALVFSIGHSNHDWSTFKRLLETADIGAVADVRSSPASRLPHFNRAALKDRLNASGIAYVFLGLELGGRPKDGCPPDYEVMAAGPASRRSSRSRPAPRLALMCSEHEPLTCHRCLLVGRRLVERGVAIAHILRDGTVEPNEHTEGRLLARTRQTERDLFAPRADRIAAAYRAQGLKIAGPRR